MRRILIAVCGAIVILGGCQPENVEQVTRAPTSATAATPELSTETKQAALEQNAAAAGDNVVPSADERIDKVEA
jgi:outer membrane murein-binding lipoprotein Lpp